MQRVTLSCFGNRKGNIVNDLRLLARLATSLADKEEGVKK
jgi:hypothetical protein